MGISRFFKRSTRVAPEGVFAVDAHAPKLKRVGKIVVGYQANRTPATVPYLAEHLSGVVFRNAPDTECIRVYPNTVRPSKQGLHLDRPAALEFATALVREAGATRSGAVVVFNHVLHKLNEFQTFSPPAAVTLARDVRAAAESWT